jgi:hypothetical protein
MGVITIGEQPSAKIYEAREGTDKAMGFLSGMTVVVARS